MPVAVQHSCEQKRAGKGNPVNEPTGYFIDDLEVGMSAMFGKTITEADILMFSGVSGDTNPVHLDEEFAGSTMFEGRIAHGILVGSLISTVLGTRLPGPGAVYVSQNLKFMAPVRAGDTVRARVTITEIEVEKKRVKLDTGCFIGDRAVVTGEAVLMVRRRPQPKE
jgi:3-hydroxybutyryl-CoA dehydratase